MSNQLSRANLNPETLASVQRGIADASVRRTKYLGSFSQYVDSDMKLPTNIKIIILIFALIFCKDHPLLVSLAAVYYFSTLNFDMKDKVVINKLANNTMAKIDKDNKLSSKVKAWIDRFKKEDPDQEADKILKGLDAISNLPDVTINNVQTGDVLIETPEGNYVNESQEVTEEPVDDTLIIPVE